MISIPDVEEDGLRDPYGEILEQYIPVANAVAASVDLLVDFCLISGPPGDRLFDRMNAPQFGDLVVMTASSQAAIYRVGIYRCNWTYVFPASDESAHENYDGEYVPLGDRGSYEVYYIETLDGRGMKWTNVQMLAVPCDAMEWTKLRPTRYKSGGNL